MNPADPAKRQIDRVWLAGGIGDVTYVRALFNIGYRPDEARAELCHIRAEKVASVPSQDSGAPHER